MVLGGEFDLRKLEREKREKEKSKEKVQMSKHLNSKNE